jgi:hypothetical protein
MSIVSIAVPNKPNITKVGEAYFTTYNTVAANSGQLRVYPNTDDVAEIKAVDVSIDQAGELEIRKYQLANLPEYEVIKRLSWQTAGDRVISIIEEKFTAKGDAETFDVYVFTTVPSLYNINISADIMKRRVWDEMKRKEREQKGIDERIG